MLVVSRSGGINLLKFTSDDSSFFSQQNRKQGEGGLGKEKEV